MGEAIAKLFSLVIFSMKKYPARALIYISATTSTPYTSVKKAGVYLKTKGAL